MFVLGERGEAELVNYRMSGPLLCRRPAVRACGAAAWRRPAGGRADQPRRCRAARPAAAEGVMSDERVLDPRRPSPAKVDPGNPRPARAGPRRVVRFRRGVIIAIAALGSRHADRHAWLALKPPSLEHGRCRARTGPPMRPAPRRTCSRARRALMATCRGSGRRCPAISAGRSSSGSGKWRPRRLCRASRRAAQRMPPRRRPRPSGSGGSPRRARRARRRC